MNIGEDTCIELLAALAELGRIRPGWRLRRLARVDPTHRRGDHAVMLSGSASR
jgi:hypothetical protein